MPKSKTASEDFFATLTAFLAGACLMIMEMVASRVLAPVFGNTVFLWTSVIGLIMAALTLGYYTGGILADAASRLKSLSWTLLLSGIFVALIPLASGPVLSWLSGGFGVISGPIVATLLLFLVPGVLLGAISPIAVKLVSLGGAEVGHASGRVSAMGALGSILGTFSAGFVFIPIAGNRAILVGVAITLAALGMAGFALAKAKLGKPLAALALTAIMGALGATEAPLPPSFHVDQQTFYHRVRVRDMHWGSRLARVLTLDTTHEGAMFLDGDGLPFEYTRYIDLADLFLKGATKAAFVGGGSFAMPKRFIDRHPGSSATAYELDPVVVGVGRKYFKTDDYKTLTMITGDARLNLRRSSERYDLIFGDAYNGISSIPPHLTTVEYYQQVRNHLTDGGVYMSNVIASLEGVHSEFFLSTIKTLRKVFPEVYVLPLGAYLAQSQNIILVAPVTARGLTVNQLRAQAEPLNLGYLADRFQDLAPFENPIASSLLLTDDHCPVEIMVARQ